MQAIFSLIGFVFGFNTWKEVVASVRRIITFGAMVVVNTALVVMLFAYGAAVLSLLLFVYNKTNQFISYLSNLTSGGSNEILAWAMDIFRALGVWNAFVDAYNVFSVPIVSIITIYGMRLGLNVFHSLQNTLMAYSIAKL